ncbi:MAG: hypothetical protein LBI03_01235 [Clostridiales bacterium]|jgi:hypothetical protein|nr:hypothetical protein [Clostridiales bacterium]
MQDTYMPNVGHFFTPMGIDWKLSDIVNTPTPVQDVLYLDRNDIFDVNLPERKWGAEAEKPELEAPCDKPVSLADLPKSDFMPEIRAINGFRMRVTYKGKYFGEYPIPEGSFLDRFYDSRGRLYGSVKLSIEEPECLFEVKDTATGDISYYMERKVFVPGAQKESKMCILILRSWWVREGDTFHELRREFCYQDLESKK